MLHNVFPPLIAVTMFCSIAVSVLVTEEGVADFSDEDQHTQAIDSRGMSISAVNTTSLRHLTGLTKIQIGSNDLTEFPDFSPVASTLEYLGISKNPSLSRAGNVELAVLRRLSRITVRKTSLTLLTSTCPDDSRREYEIDADSLDLCDCQHVWIKVR